MLFLLFNSAILIYVKLDQDLISPYKINKCKKKEVKRIKKIINQVKLS